MLNINNKWMSSFRINMRRNWIAHGNNPAIVSRVSCKFITFFTKAKNLKKKKPKNQNPETWSSFKRIMPSFDRRLVYFFLAFLLESYCCPHEIYIIIYRNPLNSFQFRWKFPYFDIFTLHFDGIFYDTDII